MRQIKLLMAIMTFLFAGLLSGCYPDKIDYIDEYDLAATQYDENADFSSYSSFHVIDTVMHVTDDGEDDPNLSRDNDALILNLVRQNMLDLGYTELANPDSLNRPDLELMVSATTTDFYTYYSYWYNYWGWYGGWDWWYPGYGWYPGYPWYPGGGYYNSYSTGTLIIEMLDNAVSGAEERPDGIWMGLVDGILTYSGGSMPARLEKQINQVFDQSPYLLK